MAGIFITKGMNLRIPTGGLKITLDGSAPPSLKLEVSLDIWDRWLDISREQTLLANSYHEQVLEAHAIKDDNKKSEYLEHEFRAALLALAAMAFSIDALYASIKERIPADALKGVGGPRTARYSFIAQTFQRAARLTNKQSRGIRKFLKELFKFRDWAVHPPANFTAPLLHEELDAGVEWRFVAFSAKNAQVAYPEIRAAIDFILNNIRPQFKELVDWASNMTDRIPLPLNSPEGESDETGSTTEHRNDID